MHAHANGLVHSHESRVPDDATPETPVSRFFISPPQLIAFTSSLGGASRPAAQEVPQEIAPPVDTPPPRAGLRIITV